MAVTSGTLVVGDSGRGKTSLLATLAEWIWHKYQKVSLLYTTDGGGFPAKVDALIRLGIIRVWKLRTRGEAFESCSRACQGYWPAEFTNPVAGETPPGVSLIPNVITTFTLSCPKCGAVISTQQNRRGFKQLYMCKCKNKVTLQNAVVTETVKKASFFADVGGVFIDGLTSMNDWIMADMADKSGRGELRGETAAIGGKIVSGDMTFGGSNRSHYGFAQTRSLQWLQDANNIPDLVVGPVFTARVQRATDTNSNIRVYGPQIAGQAKTADVPAYVGNCLGADVVIDEKGRREWRLYLTEYKEPGDDAIHLCKTRAAPGTMPNYLTDGPTDSATGKPVSGVEPFTQFNLGYFMELLEDSTKKTMENTLKSYPNAPGLDYLDNLKKEEPKKEDEVKTEPTKTSEVKTIETKQTPKPTAPKPGVKPTMKPGQRPVARPATSKPGNGAVTAAQKAKNPIVKRGPGRPRKNPVPQPGR